MQCHVLNGCETHTLSVGPFFACFLPGVIVTVYYAFCTNPKGTTPRGSHIGGLVVNDAKVTISFPSLNEDERARMADEVLKQIRLDYPGTEVEKARDHPTGMDVGLVLHVACATVIATELIVKLGGFLLAKKPVFSLQLYEVPPALAKLIAEYQKNPTKS